MGSIRKGRAIRGWNALDYMDTVLYGTRYGTYLIINHPSGLPLPIPDPNPMPHLLSPNPSHSPTRARLVPCSHESCACRCHLVVSRAPDPRRLAPGSGHPRRGLSAQASSAAGQWEGAAITCRFARISRRVAERLGSAQACARPGADRAGRPGRAGRAAEVEHGLSRRWDVGCDDGRWW